VRTERLARLLPNVGDSQRMTCSSVDALADMIRHHTGFLSAHAQRVLPVAAALGPGFSVHELGLVLNEPLSPLLDIVGEAVRVGLLVDTEDDLTFRHDLIRRVLADSLPESAHIAIHARAGHALAAANAPVERVADCAGRCSGRDVPSTRKRRFGTRWPTTPTRPR
jgi:predicted ATPase